MRDISKIFMEISKEKGNKYADDAILHGQNRNIKIFLDKYIEFISVNLQAEFNRISCSALGQLKTREIGNKLNQIIEEHISRIIFLVEREQKSKSNEFINDYFLYNLNQLYLKIIEDKNVEIALKDIFGLNLLHDFAQIVDRLSGFNVNQIDRILKFLSLLSIQRRIERRETIQK
jgi:hypothetical protein